MSHAPHGPRKDTPGRREGRVPSPRRAAREREEGPAGGAAPANGEADPHAEGPYTEREPSRGADASGHGSPGAVPAARAVFVLVCVVGLVLSWFAVSGAVRAYAGPALLAFFLCAITYAVGFAIFRRIRPVRPPRRVPAFLATVWGVFAATGVAAYANTGMNGLWGQVLGYQAAGAWGAALTAPFNEELLKLAGVVVFAVAFPRVLRGPVDGFIVGALVGLGFEVAENFLYALNSISQSGALAPDASVVDTNVVRVVLTGLGNHWAMTAIAGTAVGALTAVSWRPGPRRALGALGLVLLAVVGHFLFNSPLLGEGLPGIAAKVAFLFVSAMAVYFSVRHTYRRRVREALAQQGEESGMRRTEARALASRHGRHKALARVARPERPDVRRRQEQMVEEAEDRAARYAVP